MSNLSPQAHRSGWPLLYRTAVLEKDSPSLVQKILKAEEAIALRKRELNGQDGPQAHSEKEAMDDALYVLQALRAVQLCWICGKQVTTESIHKDDDGRVIHEQCYSLKVKLEQASGDRQSSQKMRQIP